MIYLDNAATSCPKPYPVSAAIHQALTSYCANPGRAGHKRSVDAGRLVYHAREVLQRYFHACDPFSFTFHSNCTDALNLAIQGVLCPGDHVVTTAYEHNSVLRVLTGLSKTRDVRFDIVYPDASGKISPRDIHYAITPDTRLVICNHISNVNGQVQPIEEIGELCAKQNILFLVDGAQSVGMFQYDLSSMPIDMLAFPGHKGLLGPQGTGALYVRPEICLQPLKYGGTGSESLNLDQPACPPERYESGTLNVPGIAGLTAGVEFVSKNYDAIHKNELGLAKHLVNGLNEISNVRLYSSQSPECGVVLFNIADIESTEVADYLDKRYNIACRAGFHCAPLAHRALGTIEQGGVRISIGFNNTLSEINTCLTAIRQIAYTQCKK